MTSNQSEAGIRISRRPTRRGTAATSWVTAALLLASLHSRPALAQDPPVTAEELRLLRQRVEELEQKLKALEKHQVPAPMAIPDTNSTQRIEGLDQKVKVLERNRELEQEAAEAKAKESPKITVGESGIGISSADGSFGVQLKGLLQVDSRTFFNDSGTAGNDGILLRRARPILQGTVFRDFDFLFVPEFGGSGSPQILDAYLNYRLYPALQFQAGKFKPPVGLEQLQSDKDGLFNERSLVSDLTPNRDLGFQLQGGLLGGTVNYAVGLFNGVGDSRTSSNIDFDDNKAFVGRLFFQPFKTTSFTGLRGLGLGLGASYEDMQRTNTSGLPNNNGYLTTGQQLFFAYNPQSGTVVADGSHWRLSPQAYYYYGPFGLMGEYAISDQKVSLAGSDESERLSHTAWQIVASYVLTGEDASYAGVVPRHPFSLRQGTWGAWQLVARYSQLELDSDTFPTYSNPLTSADSAQEWSVGLNWYLNRNVRFATSFSYTQFDGGGGAGSSAPASVTRQDEQVLFTRIQLAF